MNSPLPSNVSKVSNRQVGQAGGNRLDRRRDPLCRARRRSGERGTTLLLFPAGLLVVFLLATLAVDSAASFQAHRAATRAAAQAADDAASMVDLEALYTDGTVTLDLDRATTTARASLRAARLPGRLVGDPEVSVDPLDGTVTVTATIEVRHSFFRVGRSRTQPEQLRVTAVGRLDYQL